MDSDVPDLPFEKPKKLEDLEETPPQILHAMTSVELEEKVRDAAESLASAYYKHSLQEGSLDDCTSLVSGVLQQLGSSIDGDAGPVIVGISHHEAHQACKLYYPENFGINEIEF